MKKTLVAVAALATLSGAAFAQSTVTLYGKVDWTIQNRTQKTGGVKTLGGNRGWEVNSAGLSGSRWGLRGSEDLGGGLNAVFQLENGFNVDDAMMAQGQGIDFGVGAVAASPYPTTVAGPQNATATRTVGRLFGRQAFAGLSGGFGTLTGGRQYSPLDDYWGTYDAQGYTTNSAMGYAWAKGTGGDVGRIDNSIKYKTPAMGGFRASLLVAPGENKVPGLTSAGSNVGASVGYANGPISVDLAYESLKTNAFGPAAATTTAALTTAVSSTLNSWILGASYDFGAAKLYGAYERANRTGGADDSGWMLGVGVPFGAFSLNVGYATEKHDANTVNDGRSSAFGGQLVYSLSKRTNVYVDFLSGKTRPAAGAAGAATTKDTTIGVGMRHDF